MIDWTSLRIQFLGEKSEKTLLPEVRLPVLPRAVSEFTDKAEDPDCDPRELGRIIEADAGLTCQLLRQVNSAATGLLQKANTAQQALMMLGIRRVKLHLITAALKDALPVRQLKLINLGAFWSSNLERGLLARQVARLLKADEELAFAAGLLQDFLLPVLTNELYTQYLEFLRKCETEPCSLVHFEQQVFGWNHAEAAARVMFDWGFPDDLICCIFFQHHGLPLLADKTVGNSAAMSVAISGLMPDPLRQTPEGIAQLYMLEKFWKVFRVKSLAEQVCDDFQSQSTAPLNYIPFKNHCQKFEQSSLTEVSA